MLHTYIATAMLAYAHPHSYILAYLCLWPMQGLGWYTATLQLDADGDAAHAFYQEQPESSSSNSGSQLAQVGHAVPAVVSSGVFAPCTWCT